MKKQLFALMLVSVLFISLFSFSLVLAQEDDSDDDDSNDNDEERTRGPGERSDLRERTQTITRNGEEFTITQTREFTRTRNEDGTITQVKIRVREVVNEDGEVVRRISFERTKEKSFSEKELEVETELEIEEETEDGEKKIKIRLSNGERRELRILPDQASDIAKERLKLRNLTRMELKEIIHKNVPRVVYHIEGDKQGRFLGIFKFAMKVSTEVDPETGEVITTSRPWWAFLVNEQDDSENEQDDEIEDNGNETEDQDEEALCTDILTEVECTERVDCQNVLDESQLWTACEEIPTA